MTKRHQTHTARINILRAERRQNRDTQTLGNACHHHVGIRGRDHNIAFERARREHLIKGSARRESLGISDVRMARDLLESNP